MSREILEDKIITADTYQAHLIEAKIRQWIEQGRAVRVRLELLERENNEAETDIHEPDDR